MFLSIYYLLIYLHVCTYCIFFKYFNLIAIYKYFIIIVHIYIYIYVVIDC